MPPEPSPEAASKSKVPRAAMLSATPPPSLGAPIPQRIQPAQPTAPKRAYHPAFDAPAPTSAQARQRASQCRNTMATLAKQIDAAEAMVAGLEKWLAANPAAWVEFDREGVNFDQVKSFTADVTAALDKVKPRN